MKIGILTFVNTSNYGASLQAYALQQTLIGQGSDCDILLYNNEKVSEGHNPKAVFRRKGLKALAAPLVYVVYKRRLEKFRSFESKYCSFSVPCDKTTLPEIAKQYDRIVVGSDQVWNTELTGDDLSFFLDFQIESEKKYSYAASIGKPFFADSETEKYCSLLSDFQNISIRENESYDRFKSLPGLSQRLSCDCDPTFLLNGSWDKFISADPVGSDYIFMYFVPEHKELLNQIRAFAKKKNCKIVLLKKGAGMRSGMKIVNVASPSDFVNYIAHAKYVISGSFHALAFSLMLGIPFFATSPPNKDRIARITSLLSRFDLSDRLLVSPSFDIPDKEIDLLRIHDLIENWKDMSMQTIRFITSAEDEQ